MVENVMNEVAPLKPLLEDEALERYARHIILREVGGVGQAKLLGAKVLVVGAGGSAAR